MQQAPTNNPYTTHTMKLATTQEFEAMRNLSHWDLANEVGIGGYGNRSKRIHVKFPWNDWRINGKVKTCEPARWLMPRKWSKDKVMVKFDNTLWHVTPTLSHVMGKAVLVVWHVAGHLGDNPHTNVN